MASGVVTNQSVLTVDGVTKSFSSGPSWRRRRVEVLRGASLEVRPGELVGLVGENGSGKNTMDAARAAAVLESGRRGLSRGA